MLLTGSELKLSVIGNLAKALAVFFFTRYNMRLLGWEKSPTEFIYNAFLVEQALVDIEKVPVSCPLCRCCCSPTDVSTPEKAQNFIKKILFSTTQFLIVIAAIFCIELILVLTGNIGSPFVDLISIVEFISTAIAIYHMIVFSTLMREFKQFAHLALQPKFLTVIMIALVTQVQANLLSLLVSLNWFADTDENSEDTILTFTLNLLICLEMSAVAFAQLILFPPEDYTIHPKAK